MSPPQVEVFYSYICTSIVATLNGTRRLTTFIMKIFDTRSWWNPSSNYQPWYHCRSWGVNRGIIYIRFNLQSNDTNESGHHTFTQNLKPLSLWIFSLIKNSTSTFLSNMILNFSNMRLNWHLLYDISRIRREKWWWLRLKNF
jgi:hypothetical protein